MSIVIINRRSKYFLFLFCYHRYLRYTTRFLWSAYGRLRYGGRCPADACASRFGLASPGKILSFCPEFVSWTLGRRSSLNPRCSVLLATPFGRRLTRLTSVRLYPPFILPFRHCRSSGSRNWNTYSSRCFTITVLRWLLQRCFPKMCYRTRS